ncbi:flagellar protein FliT [Cytobacillus suaedae]|nr:flagellar protein FliT [Cytobacillus suaedae]
MSSVKALYLATKELYDLLQKPVSNEDRESLIPKVEELLDARQSLIEQVSPPYTDGEKKLGAEVVKLNKVVDEKLALLKQEIQLDINQLKKKKTSTNKYTNPYESVSSDGMFFDKRK